VEYTGATPVIATALGGDRGASRRQPAHGYVVLRGSDPTLAWYAYASRVDQVTGDAVYRAARGRQADLA